METRNPPCDSVVLNQSVQAKKVQLFESAIRLQRKLASQLREKFSVELSSDYVRPTAISTDDHQVILRQLEQLQQFCERDLTIENFSSFFIEQQGKFDEVVSDYHLKALYKLATNGVSRISIEAKYLLQLQKIHDLKTSLNIQEKSLELDTLLQRELTTEADYINFCVELQNLCKKDVHTYAELTNIQGEILDKLETYHRQVLQCRYTLYRSLQAEGEERLLVNDVLHGRALDAEDYITIPTQRYHYDRKHMAMEILGEVDLESNVNCHLNPQEVADSNRRKVWQGLKQEAKIKIIKLFMRGELTKNNLNTVLRSIVLQIMLGKLQHDYLLEEKKMLLRWYVLTPRSDLNFHDKLKKNIELNDNCIWFAGRAIKTELYFWIKELESNNETVVDYADKLQKLKTLLLEIGKKFVDDPKLKLANQFFNATDLLGDFCSHSLNNLAQLDSFLADPDNPQHADCLDKEVVEFVAEVKGMMQEVIAPTLRVRAGTGLSSESQEREDTIVSVESMMESNSPALPVAANLDTHLGSAALATNAEINESSVIPSKQANVQPHRQRKNPPNEQATWRSIMFTAGFALLCIAVVVVVLVTVPISLAYLATAGSITGAGMFGGLLGFGIDQATKQDPTFIEKPPTINATTYGKLKKDLVPGDEGFVAPRKYTNAAQLGRRPADRGFAGTAHGTYDANLRKRISQRGMNKSVAPPQNTASFRM